MLLVWVETLSESGGEPDILLAVTVEFVTSFFCFSFSSIFQSIKGIKEIEESREG